jgi:transposase-like protein
MAQGQDTKEPDQIQASLLDDPEYLRGIVERVLQQFLENEISTHLGAAPYERTSGRIGHRNGRYLRTLKTRVGKLTLSVPRDREGQFQTALFGSYQRHERAFLLALMEMTLQGVSTRKVSEITEALCGTSYSASLVSSLSKQLDDELEAWRNRPLSGNWPYIFIDARYEKTRHNHRVVSQGVLIVIGVNDAGHRSILAVDVVHSENESDYSDLFKRLQARGLTGVELVISDDHAGLGKAVGRYFQGASWQRCQVHFMRNVLNKLRKGDRSWVMASLKDVFRAPDRQQAEQRLKVLVDHLSLSDPSAADWLENEGPETLSALDYPESHRRHIRSTNGLERLNEEIRRRTRVIRIFPNRASCLRMVSALCQEQDEEWVTGRRYLDMALLSKSEGVETRIELRRAV